ncbi:helix-turn-helix domain-containing protein [Blautia massiliensis (ex Durand et al. 2017)]|nr:MULTISPECIES: helix-turn-helix domain-containing protein [Clostridia]
MRTYFSLEMSLADTAEKLFLHKNTLQYKLNHIYKKCGLNPRKFRDAVLLYLALELE